MSDLYPVREHLTRMDAKQHKAEATRLREENRRLRRQRDQAYFVLQSFHPTLARQCMVWEWVDLHVDVQKHLDSMA